MSSCIPIQDRQQALSLSLELALQRGTLSAMLNAILLLLSLEPIGNGSALKEEESVSSNDERETDNEQVKDNERTWQALLTAPLGKFLQRLSFVEASRDMVHQDIEDSSQVGSVVVEVS